MIRIVCCLFLLAISFFQVSPAQNKGLIPGSDGIVAPTLDRSMPMPTQDKCGHDLMLERALENEAYRKQYEALENQLYTIMSNREANGQRVAGSVVTVPVVVHIVHQNGPENLSNATVTGAIQALNDAFANVAPYDPATGVNTEIQFCLAQQDPNGNVTDGITRDVSPLTNMVMETQDIQLKNLNRWDPLNYINIWVVSSITSQAMGPGVAGYAYFPTSHGQPEDGIVVEAFYFGDTPHGTKVNVHEMGHYLGLYHTFQGGCTNNNCLTDGDRICDTPPDQSTQAVVCGQSTNSCTSDEDDPSANNPFRSVALGGLGDQPDMYINYMDYGDLQCYSAFTQDQADRMNAVLNGPRLSLQGSNGCDSPCLANITAAFTPSTLQTTTGSPVTFTNNSTGANSYEWTVNGNIESTNTNFSYTFTTPGTYEIILYAYNGTPNCISTQTVYVVVTCDAVADFTSSATSVNPGDNVTFTNTSLNGTNYEWFLDGISQSTNQNWSNIFPNAGGFMVSLVTCGQNCCDTAYQYIQVGICLNAQGNYWVFGNNASLDFNSGTPIPVGGSAMNTDEGSSSIADDNGNLLFYTNGENVWNRNHSIMANGTGLIGHPTTTQGALIAKKPDCSDIYYIFHVDFQAGAFGGYGGLSYSEVDMAQNGGLGAVTATKNVPLVTPTGEKVCAIRHANGVDYWVVTHGYLNNEFYAFLVTSAGVNTTPVVSAVGTVHNTNNNYNSNSAGQIKGSPDGSKIALAIADYSNFELYDFDNSTGAISNPVIFIPPILIRAYGIEFSPDGSKLYGSGFSTGTSVGYIYQLDLNAGGPAAILASATQVSNSPNHQLTSLQLAPDGKIYVAKTFFAGTPGDHLGVINIPNAAGLACNYVNQGLFLNGMRARAGLPGLMAGYYEPPTLTLNGPIGLCEGQVGQYTLNSNACNGAGYVWNISGPGTILSSNDTGASVEGTGPGSIWLTASLNLPCGAIIDSFLITISPSPPLDLGPDTTLCATGTYALDAGPGWTTYSWHDNSNGQTFIANTPGWKWVEVTTPGGCILRDSVFIDQLNNPITVNLGPDDTICAGQVIVLDAGPGYTSYLWQDGSNLQTFTAWQAGTYWVTVEGACAGDFAVDSITIVEDNSWLVDLGPDSTLCAGDTLFLDAGTGAVTYTWSTGDTSNVLAVTQSGTYYVDIATATCQGSDTVTVDILNPLVLPGLQDTLLCEGNFVEFDAGNPGATYLWSTGGVAQVIQVPDTTADYWVQISNRCETITDSVTVTQDTVPEPILPSELEICGNEELVISNGLPGIESHWSTGEFAPAITINEPGPYWTEVRHRCGTLKANVQVVVDAAAGAFIPNVFTPNGDGLNDCYEVSTRNPEGFHVQIYDRWGNLIWETRTVGSCWDGTFNDQPANEGSYVYIVESLDCRNTMARTVGTLMLVR